MRNAVATSGPRWQHRKQWNATFLPKESTATILGNAAFKASMVRGMLPVIGTLMAGVPGGYSNLGDRCMDAMEASN